MKTIATILVFPLFAVLPIALHHTASAKHYLPAVVTSAQDADKTSGEQYTIDNGHSFISFRIKHMNVGYVWGRFNELKGKYHIDKKNASKSYFEIEIETASIDTNNRGRDRHLRNSDFFSAKQFPKITLKSKKLKKNGKGGYEAICELELHGKKKNVTVEIKKIGEGPGPRRGHRTGFAVEFEIKRSDFGMNWGVKRKMLAGVVQLWIAIVGVSP